MAAKELQSLADRIKMLRENAGLTQTELAKNLGLTRSAVNAWEMGLSVPSPQYIVELAKNFHVSTDYILGLDSGAAVSVTGLSEKQVSAVLSAIQCFKDITKQ